MIGCTAATAKKITAQAMREAGIEYGKLVARTVGFDGENRVCVRPVGARIPDTRFQAVKDALPKGILLDIPMISSDGRVGDRS